MAVSYLQPPSGFRAEGGRWVDSECVERGEVLPRAGDGDREWNERLRARWYGVEGRELDWCEAKGGRGGISDASDCGIHAMVLG